LDLLLPDMNGLEVLQQIRRGQKTPEIPILVVTIVQETSAVAGFSVHDVLQKPVEGAAILSSLERAGISRGEPGYVLVIDDDISSLQLMRATLDQLGYTAVCEQEGLAALAAIDRSPPLAIVLDLLMPSMSGFELLQRLRREPSTCEVPVIVWTAKDLSASEVRQLREETNAVLQKHTLGPDCLLEELRGALSRAPLVRGEA
jgi:CheY-like chemotaxis protein